SRMSSSGPAPPFFPPPREPPPLPPPRLVPPRSTRVAPSCIRATAPTSAASIVINRTSRFFTCPSSCATTAWSSSRLQRSSIPRREQRDDRQGDTEPREYVVVRGGRRVARRQVVDVVPAEPEPREERDEANHQQDGAPAIGFLLLKEGERSVVAHTFGFIERS